MNFFNTPYLCSLSGISPTVEDLAESEGVPEGWIEVSFKRKFYNPKWEAIQNVKQGLMQQTLAAIPEDQREEQLVNVAIQVEAQFLAIEEKTEEYVTEIEQFYVSPPEDNSQLMEAWNVIRVQCGLEADLIEDAAEEEEPLGETTPPKEEEKAEEEEDAVI
jgi:hypothetical protein